MKANKGPLGASETNLIIQSTIENLSPQQILARDELVAAGISLQDADRQVRAVVMVKPNDSEK